MENPRYDYSPIISRRPWRFPNGARVAIWVVPIVEHFHLDKPATSLTDITAQLVPDVLNYAWRDYGPRVGIWRMMEIMERHGVPGTAALNSEAGERYPAIIEAGNRLGWEWMGHGRSNSLLMQDLHPDAERTVIPDVIAALERSIGRRPTGWLSPALSETFGTPDVLAANGIEYVADWASDDQPFALKVTSGALTALPCSVELNDLVAAMIMKIAPDDYCRMLIDHFDVLYAEGGTHPRVMALCLHPFIAGMPTRSRHLDRALKHMRGHADAWFATGSEIAAAWQAATR